MTKKQAIQLFEGRKVRIVWDDEPRRGLIKHDKSPPVDNEKNLWQIVKK